MNIQTLATKYNQSEIEVLIDYIELMTNKPIGELEIEKELLSLMILKYDNTLLKAMYDQTIKGVKKVKKPNYITMKELATRKEVEVLEARYQLVEKGYYEEFLL